MGAQIAAASKRFCRYLAIRRTGIVISLVLLVTLTGIPRADELPPLPFYSFYTDTELAYSNGELQGNGYTVGFFEDIVYCQEEPFDYWYHPWYGVSFPVHDCRSYFSDSDMASLLVHYPPDTACSDPAAEGLNGAYASCSGPPTAAGWWTAVTSHLVDGVYFPQFCMMIYSTPDCTTVGFSVDWDHPEDLGETYDYAYVDLQ